MLQIDDLPNDINKCVNDFVEAAKEAFGEDLLSATLFGSAAEGKLRETSDVNLILVLKKFDRQAADKISGHLRMARATILLEVMFMLENELSSTAEAFAVKFMDVELRHKVLFGKDYFVNLNIPREALKTRLRQVLTNLMLRLRERYVLTSMRDEQLSKIIADSAGALRSAAVSLLKLHGRFAKNPKDALNLIVHENFKDPKWDEVLAGISIAREGKIMQAEQVRAVYFPILELTEFMLGEVNKLQG